MHINDRRRVEHPRVDERGRTLPRHTSIVRHAPVRTIIAATIASAAILYAVRQHQSRRDLEPHRYYWHEHNGVRYAHLYDGTVHWWGFYVNDDYFWTRYEDDRFWWQEPYTGRWAYFSENRWWWRDPSDGTMYYFEGGRWYRYSPTNNGTVVIPEDPSEAPSDPNLPAPAPVDPNEMIYISDDGTRVVHIAGDEKIASLYDHTQQDSEGRDVFLAILASGAERVSFSDTSNGSPLMIIVYYVDADNQDAYMGFDSEGQQIPLDNPYDSGGQLTPQQPTEEVTPAPMREGRLNGARSLIEKVSLDSNMLSQPSRRH